MENTPLNKAHEAGRRALKLTRKGQLEEAFECHLLAAGILQELKETLNADSLCKRSIEEQEKFHRRQAELAKVLKEFVDKQGAKLRKMSENKPLSFSPADRRRVLQPVVVRRPLPHPEIQRKLDEADSLLQILSERKVSGRDALHKTQSADETFARRVEFTIRPKNEAEVIEELRTVNINLRALVDQLLNELNESREENRLLRVDLKKYQMDGVISGNQTAQRNEIPVAGPSSQMHNAAAALSFHIAYEQDPVTPVSELPELDPLETPDFDYTSI